MKKPTKTKLLVVFIFLAIVATLQYITDLNEHARHMLYQGLFFIPVILAGVWFGLKGALITSLSITVVLLPFTFIHWNGLSVGDLNNVVEVILYNLVAVILGKLKDREMEQQKRLQEAERLAVVGKAVSGLAHDLRTPLIAIGGMLTLVKRHLVSDHAEDESINRKLNLALEETQRLDGMVREMLDFSKPLELRRGREDLNKVLEHCVEILANLGQERKIKLHTETSGNLAGVSIDHERMEQVVINLVKNAIEASPEGEAVIVRCSRTRRYLIIDVIDHGTGISHDRRSEIFIPFFTTKRNGTGLGLSIVEKIVEAHNGRVEIIDNPDKGLTFRVLIPAIS